MIIEHIISTNQYKLIKIKNHFKNILLIYLLKELNQHKSSNLKTENRNKEYSINMTIKCYCYLNIYLEVPYTFKFIILYSSDLILKWMFLFIDRNEMD
jgi:hypothetical protein